MQYHDETGDKYDNFGSKPSQNIKSIIQRHVYKKNPWLFSSNRGLNWKHAEQNNQDQHILFVKSGKGKYFFKDHEEILERGKIVYISNGLPHHAWHDEQNPLVITGLRFNFCSTSDEQIYPIPCAPFFISTQIQDVVFYDELVAKINTYYYSIHQQVSQLLCSSMITHLLSDICYRHETLTHITVQDSRIERVQRYMMDDLSSTTSIESLAERVKMSPRHLRTCFKRKYGLTPKQYQLKIRMNHAKFFLLETSDISIGKIALSLGYSDQFVFFLASSNKSMGLHHHL